MPPATPTSIEKSLLDEIFTEFQNFGQGPVAEDFRLDHEKNLEDLDSLERQGVLARDSDGRYSFRLHHYIQSSFWEREKTILNRLFPTLQAVYRSQKTADFSVESLRKTTWDLQRRRPEEIIRALNILQRLDFVSGSIRSPYSPPNHYSSYRVYERILRYPDIDSAIVSMQKEGHYAVQASPHPPSASPAQHKIAITRLIGGSAATLPPTLHTAVEEVSLALYKDAHYAQAVTAALVRVIAEVKTLMREKGESIWDGGDSMMNHAFGCDSQTPPIAFSDIATPEGKDEQRGILYLFKGIVGIRNRYSHENVTLEDAALAADYLSLASLLMRLLDRTSNSKASEL